MFKQLLLSLTILLLPLAHAETPLPSPEVVIKTNQGDFTVRLYADKSPITVANFLSYVDSGHYSGTIFHRVMPNFMIQGGGMLPDMTEKAVGEPIVNEAKNRIHNTRGTIAMARTDDPDSATAQFFINQRTNLKLDWTPSKAGYTVFGEVIDGMNTVDYIATSPTDTVGSHGDVPLESVIILEITRKSYL
ncbi:MAG: cyclophilin family peptidyl-prolyl cis-trans isomerase [Halieaceae bacterium]|jgi:cyclophilin family peptidyl-prolyl cis-trans isomerase